MEAMYSGLPVVASGVKGHTDLLQRSGAGFLYPYGDEELCAEAIQMLMGSEDMRVRRGGGRWYNIVWIRPSLVSWSSMKSWPWRTKQNLWRGKWWGQM